MKIREALINQSPSLSLQRSALDEIARLDRTILVLERELPRLQQLMQHWQDLCMLAEAANRDLIDKLSTKEDS